MKRSSLVWLVMLIMSVSACHKDNKCHDPSDPACDNYNPCSTVHALSAGFSIYENDCTGGPGATDTSWHYYPTDTVATNCVTFTANDTTADSLVWHIGAGIYRQRSFHLDFSQNKPVMLPITLTVYRHRNSCLPSDDTVKTMIRTLYFTDTCLAYGTYRGYFAGLQADTGTISIRRVPVYVSGVGLSTGLALGGFAPGCIDTISTSYGSYEPFFSSISFSATANTTFCTWIYGSVYFHRADGSVTIQYVDHNRGARHFDGHKIY